MRSKLRAESDILDEKFRKKVIEEIVGSENVKRKQEALRAYEICNGLTKKWVIDALTNEFDPETVAQMQNRATNISILRKVISKLSNTYTGGVIRKAKNQGDQEPLDALLKELSFNIKQDKADRFYELFRNSLVSTVPIRNYRESGAKDVFDLNVSVLPPHFYDVIEDESNPEVPRVVILTDFVERGQGVVSGGGDVLADGRPAGGLVPVTQGDSQEQIIADSVEDEGTEERHFIWWSDNYHFTTDVDGKYVEGKQEKDLKNPIGELPFTSYAGDQDGSYYASNWKDKVDGAIHINVALTDMFCIAMVQGWGQPVLTGPKFPEKVKGGPHNAILLKQEQGVPESKFYYASSNPPLDQWMRMIELEVALYLSTNNLSPTTVSAKLDVQNFPSGVAMMIERAESTADITKKQVMFIDGEPDTIAKVHKWQKVLGEKGQLTKRFAAVSTMSEPAFETQFLPVKPVISEKEHVETLKARKDLGLNTTLELIRKDDPGLSQEQAEEKLEELQAEKQANAEAFAPTDEDEVDPLANEETEEEPKDDDEDKAE